MTATMELEAITNAESKGTRALRDIAFGSIAGMVSKVFEHPFDLTKVRLQSQVLEGSIVRFDGPLDCLKKTWTNEGILGLYRGLPAPIVGAMVENACLFLTYSELQNVIRTVSSIPSSGKLGIPHLALAAAGAGGVTSFLLTPIELVKCKMQVQMLTNTAKADLPGPFSILASTIRANGIRGLWLGHTGTFIRETGGGAAWFGTKEYVANLLLKRRSRKLGIEDPHSLSLLAYESAFSGACAGAAFNIALFPADTVKSTIQTEEELRGSRKGTTFLKTFKELYKAQGIRGLYAGCGVTIARSIPSSAMIFLIYDGLNTYFGP